MKYYVSSEEGEAVSGKARPKKVVFETILEGKVEFQQRITGGGGDSGRENKVRKLLGKNTYGFLGGGWGHF